MNNGLLSKISYKHKKAIVSESLLVFGKMKKMRSNETQFSEGAKEVVEQTIAGNMRGTSIIEAIFKLMPADQYLVLENDFIKRLDCNWYLKTWSKGTYYKLKHKAIDQFLYYLYG